MEYKKCTVETQTILAGYTILPKKFLDVLKEKYAFIGSEKWVEARIYGRIRLYVPDIIDDKPCKFAIERKLVDGNKFDRTWFAPVEEAPALLDFELILRFYCNWKHISMDCPVVGELLDSLKEKEIR